MKRMIILLLCLAFLLTLTGCGALSLPPAEAKTASNMAENMETIESKEVEAADKGGAEMIWLGNAAFVENDACSIKATRYIVFPTGEGRLVLMLENKRPDKSCDFSLSGMSVNRIRIQSDGGRFQLMPGEKTEVCLSFVYTAPSLGSGTKRMVDIGLRVSVQDARNEALVYVPYTDFHIYPLTGSAETGSNDPS